MRDSPPELARAFAGPYASNSITFFPRLARCHAVHAPEHSRPDHRYIECFLHTGLFCSSRDIIHLQGTNERIQLMNLAGVLFVQTLYSALLSVGLSLIPLSSQLQETPTEQTSFGCETDEFDHAVSLTRAAKEALAEEQSIADLLKDQKLSLEQMRRQLVHRSGGPPFEPRRK